VSPIWMNAPNYRMKAKYLVKGGAMAAKQR
jgi:hypothetical protein